MAAIATTLPAKKSIPPEDATASTPAAEKIKKAEPNSQIRTQVVSEATVDIKKGADASLKSGDLSGKLRVTFAEDVKPAAVSSATKGKPAKASSSTGKPSTTANSVPKGISNAASSTGKINTSQRSNATPSIEKKKKKTSMPREEPTPPHITIPKVSDRAPHTVMEGFHDNLSSNEMMSLLNAKLKTLDL